MSPSRRRLLLIAAITAACTLAMYLLVYAVFLGSLGKLDDADRALRQRQDVLRADAKRLQGVRDQMARLRDRTFADDVGNATVYADGRIKELAHAAGLGQGDCNFTYFTDSQRSGFREMACTVSSRGVSLDKLVNFLYVLAAEDSLHTVTNLTITPNVAQNKVAFSLRYATVVLEAKLPVALPKRVGGPASQAGIAVLDDRARMRYDVVSQRNLFLPYVPMPKPAGAVAAASAAPSAPPAPAAPAYEQFIVTGLPAVGDAVEVHVAPAGGEAEKVLHVGDKLPVGSIVMVDYRVLPMPGNPKVLSYSRVILRSGDNYWAVELGQRLGERRTLADQELPPKLAPIAPAATTAPAHPNG